MTTRTRREETPTYKHDCENCIFVGTDDPDEGEPKTNAVDMYACPALKGPFPHIIMIRRYSSKPSNYGSMTYEPSRPDSLPSRYKPVLTAWNKRNTL